jgi:hypothetical protein
VLFPTPPTANRRWRRLWRQAAHYMHSDYGASNK